MALAHAWGWSGLYKGVQMRSQLEIYLAQWLDKHGIEWLYEPEVFDLGDRIAYVPDFYLPKLRCWIEAKGKLRAMFKATRFAGMRQEVGELVLLAQYPAGANLSIVRPSLREYELDEFSLVMAKCEGCSRWFFLDGGYDDWRCPACGTFQRDKGHIGAIHPHGGRRRWVGDCCLECGAIEGILVPGGRW